MIFFTFSAQNGNKWAGLSCFPREQQPLGSATTWASLPKDSFGKLIFLSLWASLPAVPPLPSSHKRGFSPFTIPMARISAWGCSGFYQCLQIFSGSSSVAQRTSSPPLEIAVNLFQCWFFCTKQLCCCNSSNFSPLLLMLSNTTPKIWPGLKAATKFPSPFGVKSMTKPRWS